MHTGITDALYVWIVAKAAAAAAAAAAVSVSARHYGFSLRCLFLQLNLP